MPPQAAPHQAVQTAAYSIRSTVHESDEMKKRRHSKKHATLQTIVRQRRASGHATRECLKKHWRYIRIHPCEHCTGSPVAPGSVGVRGEQHFHSPTFRITTQISQTLPTELPQDKWGFSHEDVDNLPSHPTTHRIPPPIPPNESQPVRVANSKIRQRSDAIQQD